jgi:hypothetical protein
MLASPICWAATPNRHTVNEPRTQAGPNHSRVGADIAIAADALAPMLADWCETPCNGQCAGCYICVTLLAGA